MYKRWLILVLFLSLYPMAAACGGMLQPNGNPTGKNPVSDNFGTSTLDPVPAVEDISANRVKNPSPLLVFLTAMKAQGFTQANGWIFKFGPLGNDITLRDYYPTVDRALGGAVIKLTYAATGTDPVNIHWIQIAETNTLTFPMLGSTPDPLRPPGSGFIVAVDDGAAPKNSRGMPTVPFYDAGLPPNLASPTLFSDAPKLLFDPRRNPLVDRFYTFVVTQDPAKPKSLTIYDDVEWGFKLTPKPGIPVPPTPSPEPSSLVLLSLGSGCALGYTAWRRRRKDISPAV